jgi:hypothetical protein
VGADRCVRPSSSGGLAFASYALPPLCCCLFLLFTRCLLFTGLFFFFFRVCIRTLCSPNIISVSTWFSPALTSVFLPDSNSSSVTIGTKYVMRCTARADSGSGRLTCVCLKCCRMTDLLVTCTWFSIELRFCAMQLPPFTLFAETDFCCMCADASVSFCTC